MNDTQIEQIQTAVSEHLTESYPNHDTPIHVTHDDDDDPDRFIATVNVNGGWLAFEVWLEDGEVVAIAELGEGVEPE